MTFPSIKREKRESRSCVWTCEKVGDSIRSEVSLRSLRSGLFGVESPDDDRTPLLPGDDSGEAAEEFRTPDSLSTDSSSFRGGRRYFNQSLFLRSLESAPSTFCRT